MKLRLTERARADLQDIDAYTAETFGVRQTLIYTAKLEQGFNVLLQFPRIGLAHPDPPPGMYAYKVGAHWICYEIHDDEIHILGVVQWPAILVD